MPPYTQKSFNVGVRTLAKAAKYFYSLNIKGGYSGIYDLETGKLAGESLKDKSSPNEIWIQPPGTPFIGRCYLRAYHITGKKQYLKAADSVGKILAWGQLPVGGWRFKVDVSNLNQIQENAKKIKRDIGVVDVLINNAGIIVGKYFHEHSTADVVKTMEINANAPMLITKEFLEDMLNRNSGHICNIASSGGLISNPKMSVYVASKWSVIGWSDSLRIEMKQMNKNIGITTVMPYYINTGMFDGVVNNAL